MKTRIKNGFKTKIDLTFGFSALYWYWEAIFPT